VIFRAALINTDDKPATFVDVTGIVIYFTIAKAYLQI